MEINIRISWRKLSGIVVAGVLLFSTRSTVLASSPQLDETTPGSSPASPVSDIPALTMELRRLSGILEKDTPDAASADLRDSLPKEWNVQAADRTYTISTDSLRVELTAGSRGNAKAWVDNLARELGSYPTTRTPSPPNARQELDRILAQPEFAAVHPPTPWDLFRQRLANWLARLFAKLFGALDRYPIGGKILFWVIVITCVGFIALWVFRFMVGRDHMEFLPPSPRAVASRTWQEWIRTAREAADRKDFREAVHSTYWAGITRLEDVGALPKDSTRTPRESLRLISSPSVHELAPRRTFREPLSLLTNRLERIWYGNRQAHDEDFQDALRQVEALGCQVE